MRKGQLSLFSRQTVFDSRTWTELLYALVCLPLAVAGFTLIVTLLSLGVGLLITVVGVFVLAFCLVVARGFGSMYRGLGRNLLGVDVETPPVRIRRRGILGWITDREGWRASLFLLLQLPVSIVNFTFATVFWGYGLGALTYPIWQPFLPYQTAHGVRHRGANFGSSYFLDTPGRIAVTAITGFILVCIAPRIVHGILAIDRVMIRGLLGPTEASKRIAALEQTRAIAVDESAAALRRIERDLHDGAQARLVGLAMNLGMAKEDLESGDPEALERVRALVDQAHREAKGTIIDLRDLARGIHPPALDNGLDDALTTLTARSAVPTTLQIDLPHRPSAAVETIVYFCTAELLTNAAKHSGARHASVDVRQIDGTVFVRVGDDGAGGAQPGRGGGSGLRGLADRIATVDGTMDIVSPDGGPTQVTISIPLSHAPGGS
jgi:signal transduction histidine kinase